MAFTFTNYAALPTQEHPLKNLIGDILSGYKGTKEAQYLQPNLEAELQKKQQYNKYYGPNIESQMALTKAQMGQTQAHTGLLGEQIRAAQEQNRYLPQQLQYQSESNRLKAAQEQMFNQMLQQRMQGGQPQAEVGGGHYIPGQGMAPGAFPQPSQPEPAEGYGIGREPAPTNEDLFNKKFFNLDTFSPKYKAYWDNISKSMGRREAAKLKVETDLALKDFKQTRDAQDSLPSLRDAWESADQMEKIIRSKPEFFGHTIAPSLFAMRSNDPEVGRFQSLLIPQIAEIERQLSTRGSDFAIKTAATKFPSFRESQQSALGKILGMKHTLEKRIQRAQELAGGDIIRKGNKRYKFADGELYELEKGEF